MSIQAIAAVLNLELNDVSAKMVLIGLANHTSPDGKCFPSVRLLMRYSGLSERSVRSTIKKLEELQLIRVERAEGRVSTYFLTLPEAQAAPPPANPAPTPANAAPITVKEPENNLSRPTEQRLDARYGIDDGWKPNERTLAQLQIKFPLIDLDHQVELFVAHNQAHPKLIANADAAFFKWVMNANNMRLPPKARQPAVSGSGSVEPETLVARLVSNAEVKIIKREVEEAAEILVKAARQWLALGNQEDARHCLKRAKEIVRPESWHEEMVSAVIEELGGDEWLNSS